MRRLTLALLAAALPAIAEQSISLLALDRQGQPLLDLKAAELRLYDNGHPQTIASLTRQATPSASPVVILYDLLNTAIAERGDSSPQIAAALRDLPPLTPVYMYVLNGEASLAPVHGFESRDTQVWPDDAAPLIDSVIRGAMLVRSNQYADIGARVSATYRTLLQLGRSLAPAPGRKSIVWITRGLPLHETSLEESSVDYLPALQPVAAKVAAGQVAIYSVQQTTSPVAGTLDSRPMTLEHFASITGGRAYLTGGIGRALHDAIRDAASSYLLTFNPAGKPDGAFHTLRLTCTRPGVRVQARQGYLAEP